ncbi:MAG: type III pantothenate kinase [Planctomycetota bacterium]|nr:type III pantothenate kinase [Planctomycetota bacterium]
MSRRQLLLADCGNQRLKLATESLHEVYVFQWRALSERERLADFLVQQNVRAVRLASSSTQGRAALLELGLHAVGVKEVHPREIPLDIQTSGTGIDRLLATWYAHQKCAGAVVVADCGTAFTLDVVDAHGRFLGGAIGAGLGTQQQALATACPHLEAPNQVLSGIPTDTASAVAAGTRRAFVVALRGLAEEFLADVDLGKHATAQFFLTGGDAEDLRVLLPEWEFEEHMVLKGLAALPQ